MGVGVRKGGGGALDHHLLLLLLQLVLLPLFPRLLEDKGGTEENRNPIKTTDKIRPDVCGVAAASATTAPPPRLLRPLLLCLSPLLLSFSLPVPLCLSLFLSDCLFSPPPLFLCLHPCLCLSVCLSVCLSLFSPPLSSLNALLMSEAFDQFVFMTITFI